MTMNEGALQLGFRQAETLLMLFHDVAEENRTALAGRIKHVQRLGFPPGVNVGKGVPVRYTLDQFFQLVIAFELFEFGVSPQRAIKLIESSWPSIRSAVPTVWAHMKKQQQGSFERLPAIFWLVPPEALHVLGGQKREYGLFSDDVLKVATGDEIDNFVWSKQANLWRLAHIRADRFIDFVLTQLLRGYVQRADLDEAIQLMASNGAPTPSQLASADE